VTRLIPATSLALPHVPLPFARYRPGVTDQAGNETARVEAVATRFFAAIEAGDIEAISQIYAPDALIWHNTDQVEQSVEQNLVVLRWVHAHVKGWHYEDVRRTCFPGGFVQQHMGKGTAPSGLPVTMPACIVAKVSDGRVTRIDEYIDSVGVAALTARPAS